jgi:hypothetical protein
VRGSGEGGGAGSVCSSDRESSVVHDASVVDVAKFGALRCGVNEETEPIILFNFSSLQACREQTQQT